MDSQPQIPELCVNSRSMIVKKESLDEVQGDLPDDATYSELCIAIHAIAMCITERSKKNLDSPQECARKDPDVTQFMKFKFMKSTHPLCWKNRG